MEAKEKITQLLSYSVTQLLGEQVDVKLEHPGQESFGDYSSNIAMVAVKKIGKNPMELAEEIVKRIRELEISELVEKVEVAKPGFINFHLSQKALIDELQSVLEKGKDYGKQALKGLALKRIAVEHTSPNTNKPLHVGHIRNNVLGMAVIRLLQGVGNEVYPVEIINDRGVHICKSMMGYLFTGNRETEKNLKNLDPKSRQDRLEEMVMQGRSSRGWKIFLDHWDTSPQEWVTPEDLGLKGDKFVGRYYVDSGELDEKSTVYGDYLKEILQAWEAGDKKVRKLWQQMNKWFYEGVKRTYERLGSLESRRWFESEVYQDGKAIVEANIGKVFIKQEDGSVIADLFKYKLSNPIVLRADGTSIYITQDIALIKDRKEKLKADKLIYVVANEQALHFQQLFAIAQELGFGKRDDFYHLSYGMVRLSTGPMSSRLGTVINADDLMDQAHARAKEIIEAAKISKNVEDVEALAEQVGIGAIKYTMLKYSPAGDIVFDPEKSISFEGNSAPYLQYTYARTQSLIQKVENLQEFTGEYRNLEEEELAILRYLYRFPEVVQEAAVNYSPNLLCNFLFELAQRYNAFYNQHRILDTGHSRAMSNNSVTNNSITIFRLALTQATGTILKTGLSLLGISAPERM